MVDMDSSSEDEGDHKTTNVTLGYASVEATGDEISHIGGHPRWIDDGLLPLAALAKCRVCNGFTSLLLQLNADLQQYFPIDDRRLHVLCCRKKACSKKPGSIRVFREVRKPHKKEQKQARGAATATEQETAKQDLGSALFGAASSSPATSQSNPFSLPNGSVSQSANPFSSLPPLSSLAAKTPQQPVISNEPPAATFAEKLRISSPHLEAQASEQESWPDESAFPPPFPCYFLDAGLEELEPDPPPQAGAGSSSQAKYEVDDSSVNATGRDIFESTIDKTFQKFSDQVAQNPEQVLRYEFKGQPLLYSGSDVVASRFVVPYGKAAAVRGMPRCESCGAQRAFELQLVPGLIYELEKDDAIDLDNGMEWGTIVIGTCTNNCGEPGTINFKEEWVGVQWEENVAKK